MLTVDDKLAEIRRLYFTTSAKTIREDFAKALDLLKSMANDDERERAAVFMDGLAEMRQDWEKREAQGQRPKAASRTKEGTVGRAVWGGTLTPLHCHVYHDETKGSTKSTKPSIRNTSCHAVLLRAFVIESCHGETKNALGPPQHWFLFRLGRLRVQLRFAGLPLRPSTAPTGTRGTSRIEKQADPGDAGGAGAQQRGGVMRDTPPIASLGRSTAAATAAKPSRPSSRVVLGLGRGWPDRSGDQIVRSRHRFNRFIDAVDRPANESRRG